MSRNLAYIRNDIVLYCTNSDEVISSLYLSEQNFSGLIYKELKVYNTNYVEKH